MTGQTNARTFTIRETNARIRAIVERETVGKPFWVGGLVRSHVLSDFGHEYFELYDDDHSIRCMVREPVRGTLSFTITNGMELEVCGVVRVYEKRAKINLEVQEVRRVESVLPVLNQEVEKRLEKKGLWPRSKRALPDPIKQIRLITSKRSEAVRDFEDTYREHDGQARIQIEDVRVQGQQAPREIADTINWLNREGEVDVIVLTRGGGRTSDLAVFSDYLVAEAICRSTIPVVTGIGHTSDDTFADRAADVKTITPTAAAIRLAKGPQADEQPHRAVSASFVIVGTALVLFLLVLLALMVMVFMGFVE
jgi:exodeoxyribonuclease VII large subunit